MKDATLGAPISIRREARETLSNLVHTIKIWMRWRRRDMQIYVIDKIVEIASGSGAGLF